MNELYKINGTVQNQDGIPILYAGVVVLGTSTGVPTDTLGQFVLLVPDLPVTLRVTQTGCISLDTTVTLTTSSQLTLQLNCDDKNLSPNSKTEKEEIFLKGKMDIPFLLKEKIQFGRFDFENNVQLNCELSAMQTNNFKFRTIKNRILTTRPEITAPFDSIEGDYIEMRDILQ